MALSREEIAAELAWRYLEHVRTAEAEPLTDAELDELVVVMKSVAPTGEALTEAEVEERRAAVRRRVEQLHTAAPSPTSTAPRPEGRAVIPSLVPAWRFRVACGFAAVLAIMLGTVGFWHKPPVVVRRMPIPRDIRGVEAMDEKRAHELLPRMVENRLSPQEEKDLMAHMLVCPGCFRDYVQLRHPGVQALAINWRR